MTNCAFFPAAPSESVTFRLSWFEESSFFILFPPLPLSMGLLWGRYLESYLRRDSFSTLFTPLPSMTQKRPPVNLSAEAPLFIGPFYRFFSVGASYRSPTCSLFPFFCETSSPKNEIVPLQHEFLPRTFSPAVQSLPSYSSLLIDSPPLIGPDFPKTSSLKVLPRPNYDPL